MPARSASSPSAGPTGPRIITIYLHGQGGSRKQGVDDYHLRRQFQPHQEPDGRQWRALPVAGFFRFRSGGHSRGRGFDRSLCGQIAGRSGLRAPAARWAAQLCWSLANDKTVAPRLSGLLLLGSLWDDGFLASPAFKRRVPVFFGQGSRDTVFPVERQEAFYPLHPCQGARLSGPLRTLRNRHAWHADPHDRLARDAELDAVGAALIRVLYRSRRRSAG